MAGPVRDLSSMLAGLSPELDGETYVFCTASDEGLAARALPLALAICREAEGLSLLLPIAAAGRLGFATDRPMRRIVLTVHSALDGVGLTAAVAGALAEAGFACNVVAAFHHDHLLVPACDAEAALGILRRLSGDAVRWGVAEPAR